MGEPTIQGFRVTAPLTDDAPLARWLHARSVPQLGQMDRGNDIAGGMDGEAAHDQALGVMELYQGLADQYGEWVRIATLAYREGHGAEARFAFEAQDALAGMMANLGVPPPFHIADMEYRARSLQLVGGMAVVNRATVLKLYNQGQDSFTAGGLCWSYPPGIPDPSSPHPEWSGSESAAACRRNDLQTWGYCTQMGYKLALPLWALAETAPSATVQSRWVLGPRHAFVEVSAPDGPVILDPSQIGYRYARNRYRELPIWRGALLAYSFNTALRFLDRPDYAQARAWFEWAGRFDPQFALAWCAIGEIVHKQQDLFKATPWYQRCADVAPSTPEPHVSLGYAHLTLGDEAAAVNAFERAIALDPSDGNAYGALLLACAYRGDDPDDAAKLATKWVETRPALQFEFGRVPDLLVALGIFAARKGEFTAAHMALDHALQLKHDNPDAFVGRAILFQLQQRPADARQALDEALRLEPYHAYAKRIRETL